MIFAVCGGVARSRGSQRSAGGLRLHAAALWLCLGGHAASALAQGGEAKPEAQVDGPAPAKAAASGDAGVAPAPPAAAPAPRPEIQRLHDTASRVHQLATGELDPAVDAASLFDVALGDEAAVAVEAERLRAVVAHAGARPPAVDAGVDAGEGAAAEPKKKGRRKRPAKAASEPEAGADAGAPPEVATPPSDTPAAEPVDRQLLEARLDLDRARLSFYELPKARRDEILAGHAERRSRDAQAQLAAGLSDAERRAQEMEKERRLALEAAEAARTEAERLVAEERARLLGVSRAQADFEAQLVRVRQELVERAQRSLGFHRRVRELKAKPNASTVIADALYRELRAWLRTSRDELASALSSLVGRASEVPEPGPDRLADLSIELDTADLHKKRAELVKAAGVLARDAHELRNARAKQLMEEVEALNADRLSLLSSLDADRADAITGFGPSGFEQAAAELRQVTLVLYYHLVAFTEWLAALRTSSAERGRSALTSLLVVVKWALLVAAFLWWRRRAEPVIERERLRMREERIRSRSITPARAEQALAFFSRVRVPLEWLVFVWLLTWLLPEEASGLLEFELFTSVCNWTLGGWLAVTALDAWATTNPVLLSRRWTTRTADIRLRSLKLVGRTVVVFGLILSVSERLVGRGTIYSWVFSTCWFAAIPVALIVVRWWREAIFERVARARRKSAFEEWVIANQKGVRSFAAALAGGAFLFVHGASHIVRNWIGNFDLTRRALSYLFRRELDRLAEEGQNRTFGPLPDATFDDLGPENASTTAVAGEADHQVEAVAERINRVGGGVFAVVGERGTGKTTVLRRVHATRPDTVIVDCPESGLDALRVELARALGLDDDATLAQCADLWDDPDRDTGLLIDDAQRLIHPVMGGLAQFDALVDIARRHSANCTWFFAVDEVVWRFFERARGVRPLFDEVVDLGPWREEEIAALLTARSKQAGIEPTFEHLIDGLPPDADEVDRADALARTQAGYYRLLWDYSAGNPGVALHMWRRSLGVDAAGNVCVKIFQAPDTRDLEQLPDPAVFVLRAVIQLDPAHPSDIARATMLASAQIEDALRYGLARGYFKRIGERYRVSWAWFRSITRFLRRRHLLSPR